MGYINLYNELIRNARSYAHNMQILITNARGCSYNAVRCSNNNISINLKDKNYRRLLKISQMGHWGTLPSKDTGLYVSCTVVDRLKEESISHQIQIYIKTNLHPMLQL